MPRYNLTVLGLDVSFRAEADPERIDAAKRLVEERFTLLDARGRQISKEKLLTFLALGFADDLLQADQKIAEMEERLGLLLERMDEGG